jgi:transposase
MHRESQRQSHEELLAGYHQREQLLLGEVAAKQQRIGELEYQVQKLQRLLYGAKRERFEKTTIEVADGQMVLPFLTDHHLVREAVSEAIVEAAEEVAMQTITYERKRPQKKHPGRLALPAHLPVVEIIHEPTEDVSAMQCIGEEVTEELGYAPASLFIRRHIRRKYITAEDAEGNQRVAIAALPERPLPKCEASVELLTQMIIDKHVYHLPIYRQLKRLAQLGVVIPASTADNWQRLLGLLLRPLYAGLRAVCTTSGYLQADETTLKVQDRTKKGTTHAGVMWVYHAVLQRVVVFDYQRGHGKANCADFLADVHGYLQTDGTQVYSQHKARSGLIGLACWAHVRRKFHEALSDDPEHAQIALGLIQRLYALEAEARAGNLTPEQRKELRLEKSLPLLNLIGAWLAREVEYALPRSPIGKAIRYTITLWDELQHYLLDGYLEIDNNLIENHIRPLALGRKNYLFAGSQDAAVPIAMYRSFFGTCTLNDIDPQAWLLYVLKHIASTPPEDYPKLLPQNIDPALLS